MVAAESRRNYSRQIECALRFTVPGGIVNTPPEPLPFRQDKLPFRIYCIENAAY